MSCKHLMWGHYCKKRQEFCQDAFEDHEELCVNCSDYKDENEVNDLKKIFNKGPTADIAANPDCSNKYPFMTTCENGIYRSTAENDYVSMLEMFINKLYTDINYGCFGLTVFQAEQRAEKDMMYLGYNTEMVNKALFETVKKFKTDHESIRFRLYAFVNDMLSKPHKDYPYTSEVRFVLTLILGYLKMLTDCAIVIVDDVKPYFKAKIKDAPVEDITKAVDQTRCYVKASNDNNLAEGMRIVEQWIEELAKENIPPKELTIADIEKQLGYKIKIVGEDK